jgi:hypothetical protein
MTPYAWLADLVLVLHWLFVLFVVGGQLLVVLGWWRSWQWARNRAFRLSHLLAIGFVVAESWLGLACPLTTLEDNLRQLYEPGRGYAGSFVAHWLHELLFYAAPAWLFTAVYTAFGLLVLASYVLYPPRRRGTQGEQTRAQ